MKKIAIIGLGQLGSRHLQALANVSETIAIELVDVSDQSLQTATGRFHEIPASKAFKGTIVTHKTIDGLSHELDIVIVASNSKERRQIVEQLLARCKVKYLVLEKVLFPFIDDYKIIGQLLKDKQVACWVNTSRRMMPAYQKVKNFLTSGAKADFDISASRWGMGSNAVHFIDLFLFLTESREIELSAELLDHNNPVESSRKGYLDFTGTISGRTENNSFFKMTSHADGSLPVQVLVQTPFERVIISESRGKAVFSSEKINWTPEELDFEIPYQSQLTTILVEQLLATGTCELPSFEIAARSHVAFLETLGQFLRSKKPDSSFTDFKGCLIT